VKKISDCLTTIGILRVSALAEPRLHP
jgi:hypothetical protein